MYGPRSSYDSQTLAEWDRRRGESLFADQLIRALKRPDVLRALAEATREAHSQEAMDVAKDITK